MSTLLVLAWIYDSWGTEGEAGILSGTRLQPSGNLSIESDALAKRGRLRAGFSLEAGLEDSA
ncbi:MAG TPA: hypothetical protein VFW62_03015, partial [bacterium]|nr:hypothetical protein [bacterium]